MSNNKHSPSKVMLCGVLIGSLSLMLQGCGDDDDSTDSGSVTSDTTTTKTTTDTTSTPTDTTNRDPNLKDPDPADNCVINNVVLNPPSGATLRLKDGDTLKVTIDYTLINDVSQRVYFGGWLQSVDNNDYGDDRNSEFTGSGAAGRYINHFTMTFDGPSYYNHTDRYTQLRIYHGPDTGCYVNYPVNYILIAE